MQFKEIEFLLNLLPSKNNDRNKNSRGKNGTPLQYFCWKNPWTEEPGGLQSMGSRRVRHNWLTSLSLFTFMHWRRRWQPTPVFLPGETQGRGSLVGCHLWGRTESDTTEATYSSRGKKKKKNLPNYFKLHASASINVLLNPIVLIQRQVIQVAWLLSFIL